MSLNFNTLYSNDMSAYFYFIGDIKPYMYYHLKSHLIIHAWFDKVNFDLLGVKWDLFKVQVQCTLHCLKFKHNFQI